MVLYLDEGYRLIKLIDERVLEIFAYIDRSFEVSRFVTTQPCLAVLLRNLRLDGY